MKKIVVTSILVFLLAAAIGLPVACGGGDQSDDAMAIAGEKTITIDEFNQRFAQFEKQYGQQFPNKEDNPEAYEEFRVNVLEYMVMLEVANQRAASLGVELPNLTVTDEEVQTQIDEILKNYYDGDQTKFDEALAQQNMTMDEFKGVSKAAALYEKESVFLQSVFDEVTKDVATVPEDEIVAYYDQHKSEFFTEETRTVRHILISPTPAGTDKTSTDTTAAATEADWDKARATADEVRAMLAGGADWTAKAAEFSQDTGSKDKGGDLGVVAKGDMVQEFEDAMFSLKLDEISLPVRTVFGYHIIQVTGINEAAQSTLDEVREMITNKLLNQKKTEVWEKWLADTKAELNVSFKEGMAPATTTTAPSATTTTAAGQTITTDAPVTTTTAAQPTTSGTARP